MGASNKNITESTYPCEFYRCMHARYFTSLFKNFKLVFYANLFLPVFYWVYVGHICCFEKKSQTGTVLSQITNCPCCVVLKISIEYFLSWYVRTTNTVSTLSTYTIVLQVHAGKGVRLQVLESGSYTFIIMTFTNLCYTQNASTNLLCL